MYTTVIGVHKLSRGNPHVALHRYLWIGTRYLEVEVPLSTEESINEQYTCTFNYGEVVSIAREISIAINYK